MQKWFLILLSFFLFTGCVESSKRGAVIHPPLEFSQKTQKKSVKYSNFELPSIVAVLPFKSENKEASKIVTKTFYNFFSPLSYKDIEPDFIRSVVKKDISYDTDNKTIEKIAKKLGADGLIYGDVKNFGKLFLGIYSEVRVGAHLKFYSLKEHKVIWKFDDTARKVSGGISLSPWGLAATIALSAYNLRKIQVYRAAEDLFRDIPKMIPHPTTSTIESIPLPSTIIHSGMQKDIFGVGDDFVVSVDAKPNLKIYVKLPGVATMLPLQEKEPGRYEVDYKIEPNDNGKGYLKFLMEKRGGIQRSFYDPVAEITIDTTKPKPPKVFVEYGKNIKVTAKDSFGDEIKNYILEVLKDGKYIKLKESKNGIFLFKPINKRIFVRIKSIDRAKNISNPSKPIELFLYDDANTVHSSIYQNEKVIDKIVRIEQNCSIEKLDIKKDGYLIIMPNISVEFPKNAKVKIEGTLTALPKSKLIIKNSALNVNGGVIKIKGAKIEAKKMAFILNETSNAYIKNSEIISRFAALDLKDASYLEAKNVKFDTSKSANASLLVSGNSYADIKNCIFSHKPIFDIMSNSTHTTNIYSSKILKTLGAINVVKK